LVERIDDIEDFEIELEEQVIREEIIPAKKEKEGQKE
jgi:hypothetical protein